MRYPPAAANWVAPIAEPSTLETDMLPYIGQLNPSDNRRFMQQHGRMLSGLGSELPSVSTVDPTQAAYKVRPMAQETADDASGEIQFCEEEDDVIGSSGIFDGSQRRPNLNPNMGVFSSSFNVPGFISREKLFAPNKSLFDSPNGGDVVVIPGGGGLYIDPSSVEGEFSQPFGPPEFRQAAPPSSFQAPANWWPTEYPTVTQGPTLTNPYAPPATLLEPSPWPTYAEPFFAEEGPMPTAQPMMPVQPGAPAPMAQPMPRPAGSPTGYVRPFIPGGRPQRQPPRGQVQPAGFPRGQFRPAPDRRVRVSANAMAAAASRPQKLAGLGGGDGEGPSTITVVLAGAVVGAGLAMIYKAMKG